VIEPSAGVDRTILAVLSDAFHEEEVKGEKRIVLKLDPKLAPIKAAVLPLVKKDGLAEIAQDLERDLRKRFNTFYDQAGAIGRRYRRMDEVGTPYCVAVDHQTKEDNTVTIRDRDSMDQVRIPMAETADWIGQRVSHVRA
ncbi:MAG: His/Gly/Thr/Pro-type tRNA ligase C-terminal domain-containing protein, partial [Candidatus Hydrogenedentales bacterium]